MIDKLLSVKRGEEWVLVSEEMLHELQGATGVKSEARWYLSEG